MGRKNDGSKEEVHQLNGDDELKGGYERPHLPPTSTSRGSALGIKEGETEEIVYDTNDVREHTPK
jgi:hypothetical protein